VANLPAVDTAEVVSRSYPLFNHVGPAFYFDAATLARGKELGLDGFRFYFLGRGGVLGDVEAPVVASAFGYWNPQLLTKMWDTARQRFDARTAGREYVACCQEFGRRHFADLPLGPFCAAAEAVDRAADPGALALYAGLSAEPLADDVPARAMQLAALLRELRGSAHLVANVAVGLDLRTAHYLRRPDDLALFGWPADEPPAVSDDDRARQADADALTDRIVTPAFAALDAQGARDLVDGLQAMADRLGDWH
jgi:hypothetical protein